MKQCVSACRALLPASRDAAAVHQPTITTTPSTGVRHFQENPFGSRKWQELYAKGRTAVDGMNGYLKNLSHQSLAAAVRRRVRGIAAQTIFVAMLLAAANLRKLSSLAEAGEPARYRARRRTPRASATTGLPERARAESQPEPRGRSHRRNNPGVWNRPLDPTGSAFNVTEAGSNTNVAPLAHTGDALLSVRHCQFCM